MTQYQRPIIIYTAGGKADDNQVEKLNELAQRLAAPNAKLLLHLHGGLVDEASGKGIAERLAGSTEKSWNLPDEWVQVYVVWRTGAIETIRDGWLEMVKSERLYQTILKKLFVFIAKKVGIPAPDGSRSVVSFMAVDEKDIAQRIVGNRDPKDPFTSIEARFAAPPPIDGRAVVIGDLDESLLRDAFEMELSNDEEWAAAVNDIDAVVNAHLPGRGGLPDVDRVRGEASIGRLSKKVQSELQIDKTPTARGIVSVGAFLLKHAGKIAQRTFKRFRTSRDHGLHATIVEELCRELYGDLVGALIWNQMLHHAEDHFAADGFGSALLQIIDDANANGKVVVTAHSAGSIWASHMLLQMQARGMQTKVKLFLLAPAVRQDLFASVIENAADRIDTCQMFTMSDKYERLDPVLGEDYKFLYPSSLLYCVSGMFEERDEKAYLDAPLLGMRRFASASWLSAAETQAADTIAKFFQLPQNGITEAVVLDRCEAVSHGTFDQDKHTLKSVVSLF